MLAHVRHVCLVLEHCCCSNNGMFIIIVQYSQVSLTVYELCQCIFPSVSKGFVSFTDEIGTWSNCCCLDVRHLHSTNCREALHIVRLNPANGAVFLVVSEQLVWLNGLVLDNSSKFSSSWRTQRSGFPCVSLAGGKMLPVTGKNEFKVKSMWEFFCVST